MKITGVDRVIRKLRQLEKRYPRVASVAVGYTKGYAIYVHENLEARHKPGKTAKYLETPAREMRAQLGDTVVTITKATGDLMLGLYTAGLSLQRASQKIVPIEFGDLRGSAFTEKEK